MGYVVVVRSGDPPEIKLYAVKEQLFTAVIALLESEPPPSPGNEQVKIITPMNLRAGPGSTFELVGVLDVDDYAVVLERRHIVGWAKDWLSLGRIWRAGKEISSQFVYPRWVYGGGVVGTLVPQ